MNHDHRDATHPCRSTKNLNMLADAKPENSRPAEKMGFRDNINA